MLRSILLLVPAAGLACVALGGLRVGSAAAPEKALEFVRLELSDGTNWTLGEGGVGRPFQVRLVLANNGKQPITIWEPTEAEGSNCPQVVLTDAKGLETVLRPRLIGRAAGVPTGRTLAPAEVFAIELELLRLVDVNSPPFPGDYTIRAVYRSEPDENPFVKNVWTGTVQSQGVAMKIVPLPARKGEK